MPCRTELCIDIPIDACDRLCWGPYHGQKRMIGTLRVVTLAFVMLNWLDATCRSEFTHAGTCLHHIGRRPSSLLPLLGITAPYHHPRDPCSLTASPHHRPLTASTPSCASNSCQTQAIPHADNTASLRTKRYRLDHTSLTTSAKYTARNGSTRTTTSLYTARRMAPTLGSMPVRWATRPGSPMTTEEYRTSQTPSLWTTGQRGESCA